MKPVALTVLGYLVLVTALWLAWYVRGITESPRLRRLVATAAALVVFQVGLGFASVYTTLGVVPVSLHTLVAASILSLLVAAATLCWPGRLDTVEAPVGAGPAMATSGTGDGS